jgi:hypothetical protein
MDKKSPRPYATGVCKASYGFNAKEYLTLSANVASCSVTLSADIGRQRQDNGNSLPAQRKWQTGYELR